ncbi:MAG: carbohydrate ABC transporter permease [Firmicutes bacterium]|nr:carbohydrate ABC transporter permease [Bacillota bacterium]
MGKRFNFGSGNVLLAFAICFSLFPIFYLVLTAIKPVQVLFATPPRWWFALSFEEFTFLGQDQLYRQYLINSIVVTSLSTLVALLLGVTLAYSFSKYNFAGKEAWFFLIMLCRAYPPITTLIPIYLLMRFIGLSDTLIGLILVYAAFQVPMVVWIMRSFFSGVPNEISESAQIDGCSPWIMFWQIMVPLVTPGIIAAGILIFILNWNEFLFAFVLTSVKAKTLPVMIMTFSETDDVVQWGKLSALGVTTILPVIIFGIGLRRYLVQGLTAGAIKG